MSSTQKRVCVIGLGRFGASLARHLAERFEVLAIDRHMDLVNEVGDHVQRAVCVDARDYAALAAVVSPDFDEGIVAIGDSLESSILSVLHLKRIGVTSIRAKANSRDHAEILEAMGASQVVFPEEEAAERLAVHMSNPNLLDFVPLARDFMVMEVEAPPAFVGRSLLSLQLRRRFGLFVIAIKEWAGNEFTFMPQPSHVIAEQDVLMLIGREDDVRILEDSPETIVKAVMENGEDPDG